MINYEKKRKEKKSAPDLEKDQMIAGRILEFSAKKYHDAGRKGAGKGRKGAEKGQKRRYGVATENPSWFGFGRRPRTHLASDF